MDKKSLPASAEIHPFDVADIGRNSRLLKQLSRQMLSVSKISGPSSTDGTIAKKMEFSLGSGLMTEVFRATGEAAITAMRFTGKSKDDLKGLWLDGIWDGNTAVHAPLHMLAGVSANLEDTTSLPATVDGVQVTLRWFIPFGTDCRLLVSNETSRASMGSVEVWTQPIDRSRYPLRFHANYLQQCGLKTDAANILTLADVVGPGRFVGCVLGVDSRSDQGYFTK